MVDLSIGEVAGAINLGLLFLQLTLPLLQTVVLIGMIRNRQTATTWSTVSQLILSTLLPTIFFSDTTAGRNMDMPGKIVAMKYIILSASIIVAVSGVITPIGLGQNIILGPLVNASFGYAPDTSIFGQGTPSRTGYAESRNCNGRPCPGWNSSDVVETPYGPQPRPDIPTNIIECFESGTRASNDLRCNPFEIQFRQFTSVPIPESMPGLTNTTGGFSILESVLLDDSIEAREGIILDLVKGGIGLRNHTVPIQPQMRYGAQWTEDILWIEPVTSCVNTNWTLETRVQLSPFNQSPNNLASKLEVVNNGYLGGAGPYKGPISVSASQEDPLLKDRALIAAYRFGHHVSQMVQNITSAATGSRGIASYDISDDNDALWNAFVQFGGSSVGLFLGQIDDYTSETTATAVLPMTTTTVSLGPGETASAVFDSLGSLQKVYLDSNQFNLSDFDVTKFENYTSEIEVTYLVQFPLGGNGINLSSYTPAGPFMKQISDCENVQPEDAPSIDNLFVKCGYAITPPRPTDGSTLATTELRNMTQSIYVCASTIRASVKTVSLYYNGSDSTPSLSNLKVLKADPKVYDEDSERPIWGVENPGPEWNISDLQLLWGLVDAAKYSNSSSLWTVQKESLYLPSFIMEGYSGVGFGDSMPPVVQDKLSSIHIPSSDNAYGYGPSYDGTLSLRMMLRWQNLSDTSEDVAKIPNLIWTDRAGNMLLGTKSLLDALPPGGQYQVRTDERRITYKYLYGIPALFCWALWLTWIGAISIFACFGNINRIGIKRCKELINQLSVGRALAIVEYPHSNHFSDSTTKWIKSTSSVKIDLDSVGTAKAQEVPVEKGNGDERSALIKGNISDEDQRNHSAE